MNKEQFRRSIIEDIRKGLEPEEIFKKYQEHIPIEQKIRFMKGLDKLRDELKPIQLEPLPKTQTGLQIKMRVPRKKHKPVRTSIPLDVWNYLNKNTNNICALIRIILLKNYKRDIREMIKESEKYK